MEIVVILYSLGNEDMKNLYIFSTDIIFHPCVNTMDGELKDKEGQLYFL
jgi:hypothetical protein